LIGRDRSLLFRPLLLLTGSVWRHPSGARVTARSVALRGPLLLAQRREALLLEQLPLVVGLVRLLLSGRWLRRLLLSGRWLRRLLLSGRWLCRLLLWRGVHLTLGFLLQRLLSVRPWRLPLLLRTTLCRRLSSRRLVRRHALPLLWLLRLWLLRSLLLCLMVLFMRGLLPLHGMLCWRWLLLCRIRGRPLLWLIG
jgi:hypothetical protein